METINTDDQCVLEKCMLNYSGLENGDLAPLLCILVDKIFF